MRLLSVDTLCLEEFEIIDDLRYAILSHTWSDDEVTFSDMLDPASARAKRGFSKIEMTCELAREAGLKYAWIDTCCINKESSTELQEAINSMFEWYQQSAICFVFLDDLPQENPRLDDPIGSLPAFRACRWFRRGWTLQELIAPNRLEFYDQAWKQRGTKAELRKCLADITGVDVDVLADSELRMSKPIARRMSWAARRQTRRREDVAYCLLGIFGVHMTMIYGEGHKAFIRLQEEIAKKSNDRSLFAWEASPSASYPANQKYHGLFAQSPADFAWCIDKHGLQVSRGICINSEFTQTNNGLRFETHLARGPNLEYMFDLSCEVVDAGTGTSQNLYLYLDKTRSGFVRIRPKTIVSRSDPIRWYGPRTTVYIRPTVTHTEAISRVFPGMEKPIRLVLNFNSGMRDVTFRQVRPRALWDNHSSMFLSNQQDDFIGMLEIRADSHNANLVLNRERAFECVVLCGLKRVATGPDDFVLSEWAAVYTRQSGGDNAEDTSVFDILEKYKNLGDEILLHELRRFVLERGHQHPPADDTLVGATSPAEQQKPRMWKRLWHPHWFQEEDKSKYEGLSHYKSTVDLGFQRRYEASIIPLGVKPLERDGDRGAATFLVRIHNIEEVKHKQRRSTSALLDSRNAGSEPVIQELVVDK